MIVEHVGEPRPEVTNNLGADVPPDPAVVELAVWAYRLDTEGRPTSYVEIRRWKTVQEVFQELKERLDIWVCPQCHTEAPRERGCYERTCPGCQTEMEGLLDEYMSLMGDLGAAPYCVQPCGPVQRVLCFPVTGDNEGHYVHFGALYPCSEDVRERHYRDWGLLKTFRGMGHAFELTRRIVQLLQI